MSPRDLVREAARGVRLHRLRSLLTAASFSAGTAAAVALFAITGGARAEILRQIRALGADVVSVRPLGEPARGEAPPLTFADVEALRGELAFIREAAPVRAVESRVLLPDQSVTVRVIGTTADYFAVRRLRFDRGRAFSAAETARGAALCVLGAGAARRLIPSGDAYGSLVKVGGNWYRVIGILAADPPAAAGGEAEGGGREVFLPIASTFERDLSTRQGLREIWLRLEERIDPEGAAPVIERALSRRHEGKRQLEVATAEMLLRQHRAARGLLDTLLGLVAFGAFGLGAVGMASISWQGAAERTREIAVRRAVGARREEILAQFLLEGLVLAAASGVAGASLGALASGLASLLGGWPWLLSPASLAAALAIVLAVGLLSTIYPAYRAATLDPVAALRDEA